MKKAFSLVEMLVVVGIIAVLVGFTIPAINALQKSYDSTGADSMISAALATARTLAISNHNYAGVRFQKAWKSTDDPNKADQYMIFIIYTEPKKMGNLTDAFRAIEGYKPVKLPANIGVMDMKLGCSSDAAINLDSLINEAKELIDTTSFSIVFSPAGKLVICDVQTRNKDGKNYNDNSSTDNVFNIAANVNNDTALFIQDDPESNTPDGLDKEKSRNKFVIYDRQRFNTIATSQRYSRYLKDLQYVFVNPYTGQLIEK
ncbi:MAG: prepilin-type N-terminal cleavage/methylation domain-containing protein [Sedimentisphaerales bacterium]|jgi:prepilin-type N-terminal cleavage/methylation domain-containing protein